MSKTLSGIVSSDRGDKTIVVTVRTRKTHPIYKKQYTISKKFMAHDQDNEAKMGDQVIISESRPLSARKRFVLEKIVERAAIRHEEPEEIVKPPVANKKVEEEVTKEPTISGSKTKKASKAVEETEAQT